jgi:cyclohexanecarboxylate-CoA ligase
VYLRPGGPWGGATLDACLDLDRAGPDRLVDGEVRLSGREVEAAVASLAGALRHRGVRRRDVVAWQLPNWHEAVLLYRACWRLGAVAAPLHHGFGASEVTGALDLLEPRLLLAEPGSAAGGVAGAVAVRGGWDEFRGLLEGARPVAAGAGRPSDLATVLFTSGSAGSPKAVLHTQRGLAYKARLMARVHGLTGDDCVLMPAPLAHVSGLLNAVLVPGAAAMRTVLMSRWDPEAALGAIARERVTFMVGPPTFFVGLMEAPGFAPERVESLRLVSSGGAGVSPAFVIAATERLGCRVKRTYGSTEAPTVTTSTAADPVERARETDGRAVGEAEVRISDPSTGRPLPPGEVGEVWLRGPELFAGYADVDQTRAAFRGGWFRTDDLGTLDADGWLTIAGRRKEVIIRGGENVAAAEVEAQLEAHPAVRQAVAVGYPDPVLGERVAAFVVTGGAPFAVEDCRSWFAQRGVARFKTPERVILVDALPLLAAGKPDRAALRRRLEGGR